MINEIQQTKLLTINDLYKSFDGSYGREWARRFPTASSIENWKQSWGMAFYDEKITFDEVRSGFKICIKKHPSWPPTLGEFLNCCRPKINPEEAYFEAIEQMIIRSKTARHDKNLGRVITDEKWSNPIIYWAAASMGCDLRQKTYDQIKYRWAVALEKAVSMKDKVIPAPQLLLDAPQSDITSKEKGYELFRSLRGMFSKRAENGVLSVGNAISDAYRELNKKENINNQTEES